MLKNAFKPSRIGSLKQLIITGIKLLPLLYTGVLVIYFVTRWLGGSELWFVDILSYVLPWLFVPLVALLPVALFRRSRVLLVCVTTLLMLFLLTYGHFYCPRRSVPVGESTFTVMTYNVYIRNSDVNQIAAIIDEHHPDIVGLHELNKSVAEALESRFAEQYPYRRVELGCCSILSRYPVLDYQTFQLGEDWAQQVTLDINGHPVDVFNVHLQMPLETKAGSFNLSNIEYCNNLRDANVQDMLSRLKAINIPVIAIGDFNLTDQQSPYITLTHHLRDAHRESGKGMGFTARFLPLGLPMWRIEGLWDFAGRTLVLYRIWVFHRAKTQMWEYHSLESVITLRSPKEPELITYFTHRN